MGVVGHDTGGCTCIQWMILVNVLVILGIDDLKNNTPQNQSFLQSCSGALPPNMGHYKMGLRPRG